MNSPPRVEGVTFDFGQTLAALDEKFLSARLLEKGIEVSRAALERAMPFAVRLLLQLRGMRWYRWHCATGCMPDHFRRRNRGRSHRYRHWPKWNC